MAFWRELETVVYRSLKKSLGLPAGANANAVPESLTDKLIMIISILVIFSFAIVQLTAGFAGIAQAFGPFWAWVVVIACVGLRFLLPIITISYFYGAINVWGWHWTLAAFCFAVSVLFTIIMFSRFVAQDANKK